MDQSALLYDHLCQVNDPEIPVLSLHDMGILRSVAPWIQMIRGMLTRWTNFTPNTRTHRRSMPNGST